jgi:predicted metal-dependent hydrolase
VAARRERRERALAIGGETVSVRVHAYGSARRLRLTVRPDGEVRLSVPWRTSDASIDRFLADTRPWLSRTLDAHRTQANVLGLARPGYVPLGGRLVPVRPADSAWPVARFSPDGGTIQAGGESEAAARAVGRLLRRLAREQADRLCAAWAPQLGVEPCALRIADQRTRWGSASTTGTVSLNWRLVLAPPAVLEYVAVHELCHLREMSHAPAFWSLVSQALPGHRTQRDWLRAHGGELRRWSPSQALQGIAATAATAATAFTPAGVTNDMSRWVSSPAAASSSSSPRSSGSR